MFYCTRCRRQGGSFEQCPHCGSTEVGWADEPIGSIREGRKKRRSVWGAVLGIGCLAMISVLILPSFLFGRGSRPIGQVVSCKLNLKNIATALEMYSSDNQGEYPRTLAALTPNYLKSLPNCPAARYPTYVETYQWDTEPARFTFFCAGNHHDDASTPANYPMYTSLDGVIER